MTIAISVMISAFNALSLSPAMAALLLKPKDKTEARPAGALLQLVQPHVRASDRGYVGISAMLIRKAVVALALLAIITVARGVDRP